MFEIVAAQHKGSNRRQQDSLFDGINSIQSSDYPVVRRVFNKFPLTIGVADGVSVSPSPHLASQMCMNLLGQLSQTQPFNRRMIRKIHEQMCQKLARGSTYGSSSTLVAAQLTETHCTILNTGDSRAYLINEYGQWAMLSHDHSIINELIEKGEADPNERYADFYYGLEHCLVADFEEYDFKIHERVVSFNVGDRILLCSDGVSDVLGAQLMALYQVENSLGQQMVIWREAILEAGAADNFSMVMVGLQGDGNVVG